MLTGRHTKDAPKACTGEPNKQRQQTTGKKEKSLGESQAWGGKKKNKRKKENKTETNTKTQHTSEKHETIQCLHPAADIKQKSFKIIA